MQLFTFGHRITAACCLARQVYRCFIGGFKQGVSVNTLPFAAIKRSHLAIEGQAYQTEPSSQSVSVFYFMNAESPSCFFGFLFNAFFNAPFTCFGFHFLTSSSVRTTLVIVQQWNHRMLNFLWLNWVKVAHRNPTRESRRQHCWSLSTVSYSHADVWLTWKVHRVAPHNDGGNTHSNQRMTRMCAL